MGLKSGGIWLRHFEGLKNVDDAWGVELGGGKTCMLSGISGQSDRKLMALLAPLQWRQASVLEGNNGGVLDSSTL